MKLLFTITLLLSLKSTWAKVIDCNSFWAKPSGSFECEEFISTGDNSKDRYFAQATDWIGDEYKEKYLQLTKEAIDQARATYQKFGKLPTVKVILTAIDKPSPIPGFSYWAMAQLEFKQQPNESCRVIVYNAALSAPKEKFQQLVAHEMFHCLQYENFHDQVMGNLSEEWHNITSWWVEGIAEFFSNVTYPYANLEHPKTIQYSSNHSPMNQPNPYANAAFFTALALDPEFSTEDVYKLMADFPKSGTMQDQYNVMAKEYSLRYPFHRFAEQIINEKISDYAGGFLPIKFNGVVENLTLQDGELDTTVFIIPWTIKKFTVKLEPGRIYNLKGIMDRIYKPGTRLSYRFDGANSWVMALADQKIDASCNEEASTIEILFTRTDASIAPQDEPLKISSKKKACDCKTENTYLDKCYVGNWVLDNSIFAKILEKGGTKLKSVNGNYLATIGETGIVSSTLNNLKFELSNDSSVGHFDTILEFFGTMTGKFGIDIKTNTQCFKTTSDNTTLKTTVDLGGSKIVNVTNNVFSESMGLAQTLNLTCDEHYIRYQVPVTDEDGNTKIEEGVLVRQ